MCPWCHAVKLLPMDRHKGCRNVLATSNKYNHVSDNNIIKFQITYLASEARSLRGPSCAGGDLLAVASPSSSSLRNSISNLLRLRGGLTEVAMECGSPTVTGVDVVRVGGGADGGATREGGPGPSSHSPELRSSSSTSGSLTTSSTSST